MASHCFFDNFPSVVCSAGLESSAIDVPSRIAAVIADACIIGGMFSTARIFNFVEYSFFFVMRKSKNYRSNLPHSVPQSEPVRPPTKSAASHSSLKHFGCLSLPRSSDMEENSGDEDRPSSISSTSFDL